MSDGEKKRKIEENERQMNEKFKHLKMTERAWDVRRVVECFEEVVTKPSSDLTLSLNDLIFLQKYLNTGEVDRKISDALAIKEQQKRQAKMEKAAEATRKAEEAQRQAEIDRLREDSIRKSSQKTPSVISSASSTRDEKEKSETNSVGSSKSELTFNPTSNEPRVGFLKFIEEQDSYLMFEKQDFPLANDLRQVPLGYPLGVAHDEIVNFWFVCDQFNDRILQFDMERIALNEIKVDEMRNPSAIVIYEEGRSVAILCAEAKKRNFKIVLYDHTKSMMRIFASYTVELDDMRHEMRGLAKSFDRNLLSLELRPHGTKSLRLFKKNAGTKRFEMRGSGQPCFIATFGTKVAVSDLGVNKVFIYDLDDRNWNDVQFSVKKVIESKPMSIEKLANESGFAFVSGLLFDSDGYLLIGDAKGHTIKLYDLELEFLHRISSDFAMPFTSSFHVNSKGQVMILDVQADQKLHWARIKSQTEILPWKEGRGKGWTGGGGAPRRGGPNIRRGAGSAYRHN